MTHLAVTGYSTTSTRNRGFSLVEMMVAIVIGLILLAGVSSVMVSTKRSYNTQDSLGRMQENARIAMVIMERDLRNAGYMGCNNNSTNVTNVLDPTGTGYSDFNYGISTLFEGSEGGGNFYPSGTTVASVLGTVTPRAGTDMFVIRGASPDDSFQIKQKAVNEAGSLHIVAGSDIQAGEILMLSDCSSTDIFQVTSKNTSSSLDNLVHNSGTTGIEPGNDPKSAISGSNGAKLSKIYDTDAQLMRFQSTVYYIANGASGEPALWRRRITTTGGFTDEELVEGIENLQVLYGEDTNNDDIPDAWRKAYDPTDTTKPDRVQNWSHVVAVRFGIISRALANLNSDRRTANRAEDTKSLDIDGDGTPDFTGTETTSTTSDTGVTTKDRLYDRRMFRTTVLLRNFAYKEKS